MNQESKPLSLIQCGNEPELRPYDNSVFHDVDSDHTKRLIEKALAQRVPRVKLSGGKIEAIYTSSHEEGLTFHELLMTITSSECTAEEWEQVQCHLGEIK